MKWLAAALLAMALAGCAVNYGEHFCRTLPATTQEPVCLRWECEPLVQEPGPL